MLDKCEDITPCIELIRNINFCQVEVDIHVQSAYGM